jgi:small ligand-binding sensory domain FIST
VALMLSGDFRVSLSGRKAMDNDQVIATARQGAREALSEMEGKPLGVLAFNCAGRRGRLQRPADELTAIQDAIGEDLPLFGCYCAGEVGPLDASERTSDALVGGSGWYVMFTVLGR